MADAPALISAVALLALVCLVSACTAVRLLVPNAQQRARLRAERIERLFRDDAHSEMADAV